jgi:hypothetical protein
MQTITIRIQKRAATTEPFVIEWFEWAGGSLKGVRAKKGSAPATLVDVAAALPALRASLQGALPLASLRQFGEQLRRALAGQKLGQLWGSLESNCLFYLDLEDDALRDLPWELLEDGRDPFVRLAGRSLVRCTTKDLPAAPPMERRPLKVLVLVGADVLDKIGARAEAGRLRRLFWRTDHSFDCVMIDALQKPLTGPGDIEQLLKDHKPDIFHFVGHGNLSSLKIYSSGKGPKQGQTWDWDASDIRIALSNAGFAPRLAYLNACRTNSGGGPLDMSSVATAFLSKGTLAVIAMQADVDGTSAQSCAVTFYEALSKGKTIDEALQSGRASLDQKMKDPYLPALTVRAAVETILPRRPVIEKARELSIRDCDHLKALENFVDRHADRRALINSFLRSDAIDIDRFSSAIIDGKSKKGKTWFCWWWIYMCAWQNLPAYYAQPPETDDPAKINWLEYVRAIARGNPKLGALAPGLPPQVASQFYWEMEEIAKGADAPFTEAPAGYADQGRSLTQFLEGGRAGNEIEKKVLASFYDALRRAAGTERVILICDEWLQGLGMGKGDFTILKKSLFDPIADDPRGPIRLLLTLPAEGTANSNPYREVGFHHSWLRVVIDDFDYLNIRELLSEYFERRYPAAKTDFEKWNPQKEPLSPTKLLELAELLVPSMGLAATKAEEEGGG